MAVSTNLDGSIAKCDTCYTASYMAGAMQFHFKVIDEPQTDELDRIAIHVEASPPGAIVEVSWSPAGAHAFANYEG